MAYQSAKQVNVSLLDHYTLSFDHTYGKIEMPISTKTADYSVLLSDSGHIFTTYGAAANVNFTLPTTVKKGVWFLFLNSANYNMTVTAGTADTLIAFNDAEADSVAASTTNQKIGAAILVVSDGNKYHAIGIGVGATYTVGT